MWNQSYVQQNNNQIQQTITPKSGTKKNLAWNDYSSYIMTNKSVNNSVENQNIHNIK